MARRKRGEVGLYTIMRTDGVEICRNAPQREAARAVNMTTAKLDWICNHGGKHGMYRMVREWANLTKLDEATRRAVCGVASYGCRMLYTVYRADTDELVCLDEPAPKAAQLMGMGVDGLYWNACHAAKDPGGRSGKWIITKRAPGKGCP